MMNNIREIIEILPAKIENTITNYTELEEIRISRGVVLKYRSGTRKINIDVNKDDISEILRKATKNSLHSCLEQIKDGYITINGGHRIGICGSGVYESNKLINIKDINSVNIRISNEITGVSNSIMSYIENKNVLIISPPGIGKTTMLRDIARNLSYNINNNIVIIDERNEIASSYLGTPQNNIGENTFVMSGFKKRDGFIRAVRSLSPNIIICDEIGDKEDFDCITDAEKRGINIISSMHGKEYIDVRDRGFDKSFDIFVYLERNYKNRIKKITDCNNNDI